MKKLTQLVPSLHKVASAEPVALGRLRTASALPGRDMPIPTRTAPSAGALPKRCGADNLRRFLASGLPNGETDARIEQCLGRYVNIGFVKEILEREIEHVEARRAGDRPSGAGLAAVIGFTSAGLDKKLAAHHAATLLDPKFNADMALLEQAIGDTVKLLKKTAVTFARRNVALDQRALARYTPGSVVQFDRTTSVTLKPRQTYTGGNADFVIATESGVVSVNRLSAFCAGPGRPGENEGILDPGCSYEVVKVEAGREDGVPSQDPERFPAVTIHLREVAARPGVDVQ
jgi:hypothetical protein